MNEKTQLGIAALRGGDIASARSLLAAALKENPNDATAWLWLTGTLGTDAERAHCLRQVLRIEPNNSAATRGLAQIGGRGEGRDSEIRDSDIGKEKAIGRELGTGEWDVGEEQATARRGLGGEDWDIGEEQATGREPGAGDWDVGEEQVTARRELGAGEWGIGGEWDTGEEQAIGRDSEIGNWDIGKEKAPQEDAAARRELEIRDSEIREEQAEEAPPSAPFALGHGDENVLDEPSPGVGVAAPANELAAVETQAGQRRRRARAETEELRVIFRTRPSVAPALAAFWLFLIGAGAVGYLLRENQALALTLAVGLGVVLNAIVIYAIIRSLTARYELTNQHLSLRFRGKRVRVPVSELYSAEYRQSALQRVLGAGDVLIDAVANGELARLRLRNIPDVARRTKQIQEQMQPQEG